jgi:hypothetical protein
MLAITMVSAALRGYHLGFHSADRRPRRSLTAEAQP